MSPSCLLVPPVPPHAAYHTQHYPITATVYGCRGDIPEKLAKKSERGEFVELAEFLPNSFGVPTRERNPKTNAGSPVGRVLQRIRLHRHTARPHMRTGPPSILVIDRPHGP